jgi:hypothetical protein
MRGWRIGSLSRGEDESLLLASGRRGLRLFLLRFFDFLFVSVVAFGHNGKSIVEPTPIDKAAYGWLQGMVLHFVAHFMRKPCFQADFLRKHLAPS